MVAGWSEEAGGVWGLLIGRRRPWRARPRLGNRRDPRREVRAAAALRGRWTCGWGHGVSDSEAGARDRAAGRWACGLGADAERGTGRCAGRAGWVLARAYGPGWGKAGPLVSGLGGGKGAGPGGKAGSAQAQERERELVWARLGLVVGLFFLFLSKF